ncbi:MAG TPA: hypothetical protein H9792_05305 [Candidatus Limosilactobacillus excrementigallinarum]|nr:hypothetical protein [Candidatus Limosilactobacillus excrementigallinarum]
MKQYKVIIWGLGNVGRAAVRMIGERKSVKLVAAVDVDPDKVGKDAAGVFGFPDIGVKVTDDIDAALQLDADCVLVFTPLRHDPDTGAFTPSAEDMVKVLNAKKNCITTIPLYYSQVTTPDLYKMINDAAIANGVSFIPCGLLPGFYASQLPLYLCNLVDHVDKLTVQSGEDDQRNTSSWVKVFGYGLDPDKFPQDKLKAGIAAYYIAAVYEMGERLGFNFDDVKVNHEVFTAPEDLHPEAFGVIKKGTMMGHRFTMTGYVGGQPKVSLIYVHKICNDVVKEPEIDNKITIDGIPKIDVEVHNMIPLDESYVTSAAPAVDAIPQVVEAAPGYQHLLDQPTMLPLK